MERKGDYSFGESARELSNRALKKEARALKKEAQKALEGVEEYAKRQCREARNRGLGDPWSFKGVQGNLLGNPRASLNLADEILKEPTIRRYLYKNRRTVDIGGGVGVRVDTIHNTMTVSPGVVSDVMSQTTVVFTKDGLPIDLSWLEDSVVGRNEKTMHALALSKLTLKAALKPFKEALK